MGFSRDSDVDGGYHIMLAKAEVKEAALNW